MRASRSNTARGLRSASTSSDPNASTASKSRNSNSSNMGRTRSRSYSNAAAALPKAKSRGRGLPLSKNRKIQHTTQPNNENEDLNEADQETQNLEESLVETTDGKHEEVEGVQQHAEEDTSIQINLPEHDDSSQPAIVHANINDSQEQDACLIALKDGHPVSVIPTVMGAIIDRQYSEPKGVGHDGNQFFCEICKGFGNVVCCDGCPKVYHIACIHPDDPARKSLESDDDPWFCGFCRAEKKINEKLDLGSPANKRTQSNSHTSSSSNSNHHLNYKKKGSPNKELKRGFNEDSTEIAALPSSTRTSTRPERRAMKRKVVCKGCGIHFIYIPSLGEEHDIYRKGGTSLKCSDCLAEAYVRENERDDDVIDEAKHQENEKVEKYEVDDAEENYVSSEEQSNGLDEGDEDEVKDDETEQISGNVVGLFENSPKDHDESPALKKRKRASSDVSEIKGKKKKQARLLFPNSDLKKKVKKKEIEKLQKMKKLGKKAHSNLDGVHKGLLKQDMSPKSEITSQRIVNATPAFFFFLTDYRYKIERALSRKHKYFNRLPKGTERNELVAREGARWWVKLRKLDQSRYFTMSMRDFEEKVLIWKEEKTIREMIAARDPEDRILDGDVSVADKAEELSPEDEMIMYTKHRRFFLSTSVGSKPFTPEPGKSHNRILLELLQDMRFHPLPMLHPLRNDSDTSLIDRSKVSVPHFEVQGPIATSGGDECSGCTRGWNHFCPILKHRIPAVENRARLQPPMSSLMATRIGLGLRPKIPNLEDDMEGDAPLFLPRISQHTREAMRVPVIPSFTLTDPATRVDDVAQFIEQCLAMKVPEPPRSSQPDFVADIPRKTVISRGLLPLRGRRKNDEISESAVKSEAKECQKSLLNKCGRCRTIIDNDTGCVPCRRAQLVINTSKRVGSTGSMLNSEKDKKEIKDPVRVQTTMIGRLTVKETNFEDQIENDRVVANAIIKHRWMPSAVLPHRYTYVPLPKSKQIIEKSQGMFQKDEGQGESLSSDCKNGNGIVLTYSESELISSSTINALSEDGKEPRISRLRSRRLLSANDLDDMTTSASEEIAAELFVDRQRLAQRHRDEVSELTKRCLNLACCGIYLGIVRRDPLCLFAEPVPANVVGYSLVITNPMDISKIKGKILSEKYVTLGAFVSDVRLLCANALAYNPPGSIYSKTAKDLRDALDIMVKRATKWMSAIKDSHASSFAWKCSSTIQDCDDPFRNLRAKWPEAIEMFEKGDWLREQVASDLMRTKENEFAYYGAIAVRRAAIAAEVSLASYVDTGGAHSMAIRRSQFDDENLRRIIDSRVSHCAGPVQLKDIPSWREESLLRILRRVQNRRVESLTMSENGCARCDGIRADSKLALNAIRWGRNKRKSEMFTLPRVHESRLSLTTGLASLKTEESIGREVDRSEIVETTEKDDDDDIDSDDESPSTSQIEEKTDLEVIEAAAAVDLWDKKLEVAVTVHGSRIHGWGLFADQPFKKGDVVAEYVGEYVCNAVADAREKLYQERRIQDYQFRVDENLVIDATLKGGHGRYINHNCNPNCIAKIVEGQAPNKHLKRVMIIAQRNIKAREEITYDYQFPLELDLDARIPCNCGSILCRGFMNWDLPEKGSKNRVLRTQKRGGNMRDRIRRLGKPLKKHDER